MAKRCWILGVCAAAAGLGFASSLYALDPIVEPPSESPRKPAQTESREVGEPPYRGDWCGTEFVNRNRMIRPGQDYWRAHPFRATSNHPMRLSVFEPLPMTATSIGPHAHVEVTTEYASVVLHDRDDAGNQVSSLDSELSKTTFLAFAGLGDAELGASVTMVHWASGFLDSILLDYHDLLGLPNGDREIKPRSTYRNEVRDSTGRVAWRAASGGLRAGNLSLFAKWTMMSGSGYDLGDIDIAVRGAIKLPTGDRGAGLNTGSPDLSGGLLGTLRSKLWSFDANADFVLPGGYDFRGSDEFEVKPYAKIMVAAQFAITPKVTALWHVSANSALFDGPAGVPSLTNAAALTTFGAQTRFGRWVVGIGFTEDLSFNGDADFSAMATVSVDW